jgi:uncharacterized protein
VATIDLHTVRLRSGEQFRDVRAIELTPLELGGQRYVPVPERPEGAVAITRTSSGFLFELEVDARLFGPCMRCLEDTDVTTHVSGREYQATSPGDAEELSTPYLHDDRLDLSAWAHDALALALPEKILCRADCAGLCARCGADLNRETCTCGPPEPDTRWAKLAELRDRL